MKLLNKIKCFFIGMDYFFRCGEFLPHKFLNVVQRAIIISDNKSFRVSDDYKHKDGEIVHPNGAIIVGRCVRCGKLNCGWADDYDKYIARNTEEAELTPEEVENVKKEITRWKNE